MRSDRYPPAGCGSGRSRGVSQRSRRAVMNKGNALRNLGRVERRWLPMTKRSVSQRLVKWKVAGSWRAISPVHHEQGVALLNLGAWRRGGGYDEAIVSAAGCGMEGRGELATIRQCRHEQGRRAPELGRVERRWRPMTKRSVSAAGWWKGGRGSGERSRSAVMKRATRSGTWGAWSGGGSL